MRGRSLLARGVLFSVLALGAAPSCSAKKNTEIMISIQTDLRIPKDINAITIRVLSRGAVQYQSAHEVGPTGVHLPATIGLVPKDDDDLQPIEVQLLGQYGAEADARVRAEKVLRKVRMTFARNRVGLVRIPLKFVCYEHEDCGEGKTCIAGACATTPLIEGATMPEYTPEAVYGAGGSVGTSGACWDAPTCLPSAADVSPTADPCVFALSDASAGKSISIAIATGPGGLGYCAGGTCRVPLDLDEAEGWSWTDESHKTIRLAQGICTKVTASKLRVQATDACATKTADLPMCLEQSSDAGEPDSSLEDSAPSDAGEDGTVVDSTIVDSSVADSTIVDSTIVDSTIVDSTVMADGPAGDTSVFDTALPDGSAPDTTGGSDATPDVAADTATDAMTVTDLTIEGVPTMMGIGGFAALTARGQLPDGGTVDLTESATWTSLDPGIVSVSNSAGMKGRIDGLSSGTATIRAEYPPFVRNVSVSVSSAGSDGGTDSGSPSDAMPDGCPPSWTLCSGFCVDTNIDLDHCGMCGKACMSGDICMGGSCVPCTPVTCGTIGASCGLHPDGCSMLIDCGMCSGGMTCDGFNCVP